MKDIEIEKILYRIIEGRLRLKCSGPILYVSEPSRELQIQSLDAFDEAYHEAYKAGVYVQSEILEVLIENDMWSPLDDREATRLEKQLEDLKVQAFKSFFKTRELIGVKRQALHIQEQWLKTLGKKQALDHTTCEGIAQFARQNWLIHKTTTFKDGKPYDWKLPVSEILAHYKRGMILAEHFRAIARSDFWRQRWSSDKGNSAFGVPACDMTPDQARLCSFSRMYDAVYEHPDSPEEKIVEDDICLDGWFIIQKRKQDAQKNKAKAEDLLSPKVANAGEIFLMATDDQEKDNIYGLNNPLTRGTISQRQTTITDAGEGGVSHTALPDVQQDINIQRQQALQDHLKGRK